MNASITDTNALVTNAAGNAGEQHIEEATLAAIADTRCDVSLLLDDSEQVAALMLLIEDPEPCREIISLVDSESRPRRKGARK